MHSYAIRLKFNASDHAMDFEALLAGLVVSASKEGNHTPIIEQDMKYKEEIMDATAPFHRFRITHLLKLLNSKTEVLTGLKTIKMELLNQEVSVGIKTRPSVEVERAAPKVPVKKSNYDWETSGIKSCWPSNKDAKTKHGKLRMARYLRITIKEHTYLTDGKEKLKHKNFSMRPKEETPRSPPSKQTTPMNNNVVEGTYNN
ncbi:hypothetical protein Tco_1164452 [Tanacetum coccineum]